MMKQLLTTGLLAVLILANSCSKNEDKEGCRDAAALNYDASANLDGTCQYTKMIFYAPGDQIGGVGNPIDSIQITRDNGPNEDRVLVGTIKQFNQNDPQNCEPPQGAVIFEFERDITYNFFTRYYISDGTNRPLDTYTHGPEPSEECIIITLTLPRQ